MIISAAKATEAAGKLGVELNGLTPEALSRAYRTATKTCHPDSGEYDPARWADVSWAKEVLVRWLERAPAEVLQHIDERDCRSCDGTGRVKVKRNGFGPAMTMHCVMCAGTGCVENGRNRDLISKGD